jgi:hypothetical protein
LDDVKATGAYDFLATLLDGDQKQKASVGPDASFASFPDLLAACLYTSDSSVPLSAQFLDRAVVKTTSGGRSGGGGR